jgi:hypothetical protein
MSGGCDEEMDISWCEKDRRRRAYAEPSLSRVEVMLGHGLSG